MHSTAVASLLEFKGFQQLALEQGSQNQSEQNFQQMAQE